MSALELAQWQESEPERLEARAEAWTARAQATRGQNQSWWFGELAAQARRAAADLRAMRAARQRLQHSL